ncbi:MAG: SusC/RagA family TonB-linked outer membrane protein [Cyclobacteriaceae bacterium]
MRKNLLLKMLPLFLMLLTSMAWAQERTVTGKVTSLDDGTSLPGVNVVVKGTTNGTVTDSDGKYSLSVPISGGSLIFSFIGFRTSEIAIGDRTVIDISLQLDITQLNEVVVTALGIESEKRALGTSVSTLKSDAFADTRQTNIVNSLAGKMAGVRISSSGGNVGASSSIFIRGFTSFTQSNQPLFVVDGIPIDNSGGGNALQTGVANSNRAIDINPDDIENMTVLKGPAAAVLYGSRAISGAIIITTKKGGSANSKNTVSFTSNYNVTEVNRLPEFQNSYAQGNNGIYGATSLDSWGPKITGQTVTNYLGNPEVLEAYPNNLRNLFKQGNNVQNSIDFKGGNEKANYIFSYSNLVESGVLKNNELARNTFRVTVNSQLNEKLTMGASISYFNTKSQRTPNGNQQSNPLFRGYIMPRSYNLANYPYQLPDGRQSYFDTSTDNPLWTIDNNIYKDQVDRLLANMNIGYDITDWLNVSYKIGTDVYTLNLKAVDGVGSVGNAYTASAGTGGVQIETITNQNINSYFNITAKKQFGDFNLNFLLGNEISYTKIQDQGVTATGASVNGFGAVASYSTYAPFDGSGNAQFANTNRNLVGVYAQATVGYKSFAYITATGRNDWSSTFSAKNNSFFYPSITGSFIFTDAFPSIKNDIISYGKVRANVAQVGRTAPVYVTDTYFNAANPGNGFGPNILFPFRGQQGFSLSNASGNPDIKPEFTVTKEIGAEFKLLKDKISLDVGYFNTNTTDIILAAPVSGASGFTTQTRNAGELETSGIEVSLGITPFRTANFSWDVSANWTTIKNTVVKIDPLVTSIFLGGFTTPQTQLRAGEPYGVIVGNPFNKDANGNLLITSVGAGAGQVTANTAVIQRIGNPNPDWTGGITNTINYKGIGLSFLLDVRKGGDIISRNIRDIRFRGVGVETEDRDRTYVIDGVLRDPVNNPDGTARALVGGDGNPVKNTIALNAQQYWTSIYNTQGEAIVFDASWIRLREVSISYKLPKKFLTKTPFGSASLVLTGRNLWLYAPNYPHLDPEVNSQGVSNSQGFEYNNLPQTRSYGALLRLTF